MWFPIFHYLEVSAIHNFTTSFSRTFSIFNSLRELRAVDWISRITIFWKLYHSFSDLLWFGFFGYMQIKLRIPMRRARNCSNRDYTVLHDSLCTCSQGKGRFGVTRSFIATRSGLLRWHEHQQNDDRENTDEPWASF